MEHELYLQLERMEAKIDFIANKLIQTEENPKEARKKRIEALQEEEKKKNTVKIKNIPIAKTEIESDD